MDSNFNIEFISENNNTYEFLIKFKTHEDKILIYAPNYETALKRAKDYKISLEPEKGKI